MLELAWNLSVVVGLKPGSKGLVWHWGWPRAGAAEVVPGPGARVHWGSLMQCPQQRWVYSPSSMQCVSVSMLHYKGLEEGWHSF